MTDCQLASPTSIFCLLLPGLSQVEKVKSVSCSVVSDSLRPYGLQSTRPLCPWGFSRQGYWTGLPCPSPRDLPNPGTEPESSALQGDSLPSEPPGKPKNTGVGSLFLLQWIFLPQESNRGLLHCRRILYQLSYPGRPQTLQINIRTLALTLTDKSSHWTALSRGVMLFDLHLNTISLTDKS